MVSDHRLEGTDPSRDSLDGVLMCSTFADNGEGVVKDGVLITSNVVYRRKRCPLAGPITCCAALAQLTGMVLTFVGE